jgi:hypothetical protein
VLPPAVLRLKTHRRIWENTPLTLPSAMDRGICIRSDNLLLQGGQPIENARQGHAMGKAREDEDLMIVAARKSLRSFVANRGPDLTPVAAQVAGENKRCGQRSRCSAEHPKAPSCPRSLEYQPASILSGSFAPSAEMLQFCHGDTATISAMPVWGRLRAAESTALCAYSYSDRRARMGSTEAARRAGT